MDDFDDEGDDLLATLSYNETTEKPNTQLPSTKKETESNGKQVAVDVPDHFPFPFEPYSIQQGFMTQLYSCLELGKIGIFESPTGTGKSLSLICGALRWLKDYQEKQRKEVEALNEETNSNDQNQSGAEHDWITAFSKKKEKSERLEGVIKEQELLRKLEVKATNWKNKHRKSANKRKKMEDEFDDLMKSAPKEIQDAYMSDMEKVNNENQKGLDDDMESLLVDYDSDQEKETKDDDKEDENNDENHITKIYYCSRTHSQLSQFVREIIKSPYGEDVRVITLGSRQNFCINDTVKKLKSVSLINETCLEMQKTKEKRQENGEAPSKRRKKGPGRCPFHKQTLMTELTDSLLMNVMDMEQIVTAAKQQKACPYYGTRYGIPLSEIVALPYNILLHKSTREACGIKLQGNIVLVDEAHNLMETINNIHSVEVSGGQLLRAHSQLTQYEDRYKSRLKAKNLMYIKQILFILSCLIKVLGGKTGIPGDKQRSAVSEVKLSTANDFLFSAQLDNLNLFKVRHYCQKSLISRKLNGFVEKFQNSEVTIAKEVKEEKIGVASFLKEITQKDKDAKPVTKIETPVVDSKPQEILRSPLMHIEGFLLALTNADKDGRIVITKQTLFSQSSIKYLLLNPAIHFGEIVKEARSVIVAGGTMQPVSEFKDQLFHSLGVSPSDILEYSCGHVIPADNLLAMSLGSGPSGYDLDFTYQSRENPKLLNELGMLIQNVCQVSPGGVVCFLSSYDYLKFVLGHWDKTGILTRIGKRKKIFQEPVKAGQVDKILDDFTLCIQKCQSGREMTGALLFCVVGGKMSEGINFSDDMGRCVMMVGLPYPNIKSPELREKMDYLNANFSKTEDGKLPGQIHYENLCMKAVNQSIGRAIRHRNDYASILLLDKRYSRPSITNKLPSWICKHLRNVEKFGQSMSALSKFYAQKRNT